MDFLHGIFYLLLYFVIFFIVLMYVVFELNKETIKNDWETYRCSPLVMPFASYFDKDTVQNATECMSRTAKDKMTESTGPSMGILSNVTKNMGGLSQGFSALRTMLTPMRNFVADATRMVFQKLESLFTMVYFAFIKIMVAMKRSVANLHLIIYTLEASQMTVKGMWYGPMGGMVRTWGSVIDWFGDVFCFPQGTLVKVGAQKLAPIESINLYDFDDDIYGRYVGRVLSGFYNYKGVRVSGGHMVYDADAERWVRVSNCPHAVLETCDTKDELQYCLFTKSHEMRVGVDEYLFADFEECDETMEEQRALCLRNLGVDTACLADEYAQRITRNGFITADAKVQMADGSFKKARSIKVGDPLYCTMNGRTVLNEVLGVVEMRIGHDTYYHVEDTRVDVYSCISAGCIVFEPQSGRWVFMNERCRSLPFIRVVPDTIMYQFVTKLGEFVVCGRGGTLYTVCDYMEYITYRDLSRIFTRNVEIKNATRRPT